MNKIVFVNVPLSLQGTGICPICMLQSLLYIIHLPNLLICNRKEGSVACSSIDDAVWHFLALRPHVQFQHFSFCPSLCTTKTSLSSSSSSHFSPQYTYTASSSKKLIVTILSSSMSQQIWYSECNLCNNTGGSCFMPFYTTTFFNLMVFDWLQTWTMPREYETCGTEQNWEALCSLQTTSLVVCTRCLVQAMWFICVYFLFSFVLPTNATAHPIEEKKKQTWQ